MRISPESGRAVHEAGIDIYQHDSAAAFRFVLRGILAGDGVGELRHAWNTAQSILKGKDLLIDISGITDADGPGIELLCRMRESGARLTPALPPESGNALRFPVTPAAASGGRFRAARDRWLRRNAK